MMFLKTIIYNLQQFLKSPFKLLHNSIQKFFKKIRYKDANERLKFCTSPIRNLPPSHVKLKYLSRCSHELFFFINYNYLRIIIRMFRIIY